MNMYEEFLASLEQVEKDATSALESAGTDTDEVLGTEEEPQVEADVDTAPEETPDEENDTPAEAAEESVEAILGYDDEAFEAYLEKAQNPEFKDLYKCLQNQLQDTWDEIDDLKAKLKNAPSDDAYVIKEKIKELQQKVGTISNKMRSLRKKYNVENTPATNSAAAAESVEEPVTEEPANTPEDTAEETPNEEPHDEFETPDIEEIDVPDENVLTAGNESLLLLDCLYSTSSVDEFKSFLSDNKVELELYGLVDTDAIARESWADVENDESEVATEARNIVRLNREAQISRETARIAIGLAKQANDTLYKYYHKYSGLKREFRDKIYAKYGQRAQALARRSLMNSRSKAAMMNSKTGTSIVNKIDSRIKQLDASGRNKEAIQK